MDQILQRLDKMEEKLDRVGEGFVQMARTQERVEIMLEHNNTLFRKIDSLTASAEEFKEQTRENEDTLKNRINELERVNATQGQSLSFFERLGWAVFATMMSIATAVFGWVLR